MQLLSELVQHKDVLPSVDIGKMKNDGEGIDLNSVEEQKKIIESGRLEIVKHE